VCTQSALKAVKAFPSARLAAEAFALDCAEVTQEICRRQSAGDEDGACEAARELLLLQAAREVAVVKVFTQASPAPGDRARHTGYLEFREREFQLSDYVFAKDYEEILEVLADPDQV